MLLAAPFPPGTPTWLRLALEAATLLVAARSLLAAVRRLHIGILVIAAAAWAWLFYPPRHASMLAEGLRLLDGARALLPQRLRGAKAAATARAAVFVPSTGASAD